MKKAIVVVLSILLFSCGESTSPETPSFDRTELLTQYANQLIIPAFENFAQETESLNTLVQAYTNADQQVELQNQWLKTYTAWQQANAFNFGPAGDQVITKTLVEEIGIFPVNEENIALKLTTLSLEDTQTDTRGLLAIEYLLFTDFSEESLPYLKLITEHCNTKAQAVVTEWPTYKAEFIASNGTAAGSSISLLYNQFLSSYESIKNYKIGLPIGLIAGQSEADYSLAEAYYSEQSIPMAKAHFNAIKNIYNGTGTTGFKAYLNSVTGGPALISLTEAQIISVDQAFEAISETDLAKVPEADLINLHTELQKLTRYFKSDMSSLLGIAITFSSGDGD